MQQGNLPSALRFQCTTGENASDEGKGKEHMEFRPLLTQVYPLQPHSPILLTAQESHHLQHVQETHNPTVALNQNQMAHQSEETKAL